LNQDCRMVHYHISHSTMVYVEIIGWFLKFKIYFCFVLLCRTFKNWYSLYFFLFQCLICKFELLFRRFLYFLMFWLFQISINHYFFPVQPLFLKIHLIIIKSEINYIHRVYDDWIYINPDSFPQQLITTRTMLLVV